MRDQQQYLYKLQPTRPEMLVDGPTAEEADVSSRHFQYLQRLAEQGIVLLAGRTQTADYSGFGITIFLADSEEAARDIMHNDPAVLHIVMRAELYRYRIAITGGILDRKSVV